MAFLLHSSDGNLQRMRLCFVQCLLRLTEHLFGFLAELGQVPQQEAELHEKFSPVLVAALAEQSPVLERLHKHNPHVVYCSHHMKASHPSSGFCVDCEHAGQLFCGRRGNGWWPYDYLLTDTVYKQDLSWEQSASASLPDRLDTQRTQGMLVARPTC